MQDETPDTEAATSDAFVRHVALVPVLAGIQLFVTFLIYFLVLAVP